MFLGEVEVSLGLWDWSYTQPVWQDLQPRVGLLLHVCFRLCEPAEDTERKGGGGGRRLREGELKGDEDML